MVYVMSDIHGYPFEKVTSLPQKAGFSDRDFLFVLGDVVDRGSEGIRLLQWMMLQPNVELILGNHEAMLLSCDFVFDEIDEKFLANYGTEKYRLLQTWQANGAAPTLKELTKLSYAEREDVLEYLREAPLFDAVSLRGRDYLLTHSGLGNFDPAKKLSAYTPDELLWNRPALTDAYYDDMTVVFGHTPTAYYGEAYAGKILTAETWINVDAGAGCGFAPALLCLDNRKEYYIRET